MTSFLIGFPELPFGDKIVAHYGSIRKTPFSDGIFFYEINCGGSVHLYRDFFGIEICIPPGHEINGICDHYPGRGYTGGFGIDSNIGKVAPIEVILDLRDRLRTVNLELDPRYYHTFAEGLIPISPRSIYNFAIKEKLMLAGSHRENITFDDIYIYAFEDILGILQLELERLCAPFRDEIFSWMKDKKTIPLEFYGPSELLGVLTF